MDETPEIITTVPSKEELISKIMLLLNAPAQRLATVLNMLNRTKCVGGCGAGAPLHKGETLSPNLRYICGKCTPDQSAVDAQRSEKEKQRREESKEASRRWREEHKEEASEYKRRYQEGDGYVPMSEAEWNAKLEQSCFVCSTPGCGRTLTLETAIRSRQGENRVPICRPCLSRKAANEKWRVARWKTPEEQSKESSE